MKLVVTVELHGGRNYSRTFDVPLDDDQDTEKWTLNRIAQDAVLDQGIIGISWDLVE